MQKKYFSSRDQVPKSKKPEGGRAHARLVTIGTNHEKESHPGEKKAPLETALVQNTLDRESASHLKAIRKGIGLFTV